jgi:phosphoribosyl 1,2-cyclic phosphodiesterase
MFVAGRDVHLWGPSSPVQHLAERIATYLSPPLFPVRLEDIPARLAFHDAPEEPVTIGSATIRAAKVTHQGPTVGYRIEENGRSLVYLPDHEPSIGGDLGRLPPSWVSGHEIAHDADVLMHDGQYRDCEYGDHVGWGHSCIGDALMFAKKADVEQLVVFHHDPYHTDDELEALLAEALADSPEMKDRVCLASEGMTIALDDQGVTIAT